MSAEQSSGYITFLRMGIFVDDCNEFIWKFIIISCHHSKLFCLQAYFKVSLVTVLSFETAAHTHNTGKFTAIGKHLR